MARELHSSTDLIISSLPSIVFTHRPAMPGKILLKISFKTVDKDKRNLEHITQGWPGTQSTAFTSTRNRTRVKREASEGTTALDPFSASLPTLGQD